ncbi:hypothetical protein SESBI_04231 [Sesbania bispinosa]|nr:hypothetical protein SESBI_04231 [Sesbania bispinosa]
MRPSSRFNGFHEQGQPKKVINGARPSPLMINKDSHLIRKPSSSVVNAEKKQQQRGPIIIYTHSPKVIHAEAQDFMALVQRLTGVSSNKEGISTASSTVPPQQEGSENFGSSLSDGSNNNSIKQLQWMQRQGASDGDETSSALKRDIDETCVKGRGANANALHQHSDSPSNLDFANMPLFTPNSSDFFCSSRSPVYKFSDSPFGILGTLISPSGLGFIKELPEY